MNVIHDPGERVAVFDDKRAITPLEQMAVLRTEAVEADRECGLKPVHSLDEIRCRGGQREVEVVAHDNERVQLPTETQAGFAERLLKGSRRPLALEYVAPVVAPIYDMVGGSRKLQAEFSCHSYVQHISPRTNRLPVNLIQGTDASEPKGVSLLHVSYSLR